MVWWGLVRRGKVLVGFGTARQGIRGSEWCGQVWIGRVWLGHCGTARSCIAWKGKACQGPARFSWRGTDRCGGDRLRLVLYGAVRRGVFRLG